MPTSLSPSERILRARMAAHKLHSQCDSKELTQKARDAFDLKFENEVDPDRVLPERERKRRAEQARKAYFTNLAYLSARARRKRS